MITLFDTVDQCCGCSACYCACPKRAIEMVADDRGYLFPKIRHEECVECGRCKTVCPIKHVPKRRQEFEIKVYGVKNASTEERKLSSSGGVFIELAKCMLEKGGVVYGVGYNLQRGASHARAEALEEARFFQGSKYVQSFKGDVFKSVKHDLSEGKPVLFSGTPCEVAGLRRFLGNNSNGLITVDIICHGTPSAQVFKCHIESLERKFSSNLKELSFRNKEYGWRNQELWMHFDNGAIYHNPIWEDEFYRLFTGNYLLRDSCFSCPFSNTSRPGDITIGDYWNIKNVKPEFEDALGVSSVLINSQDGDAFFASVMSRLDYFESSLSDCTQHNLVAPSQKPADYESFTRDWKERGLLYCKEKYGVMSFSEKIRRKLSPVKKAVLRRLGR